MRKILYILSGLVMAGPMFSGCELIDPPLYVNDPAIYFDYVDYQDRQNTDSVSISFMDLSATIDEYIINVRVLIQGEIDYDRDRIFVMHRLAEIPADPEYGMAEEDDFALPDAGSIYVPAGQEYANIPVTLIKSETVQSGKVELQLELAANDEFRLGMSDRLTYKIKYSALPEKPATWDVFWGPYVFGINWGPVKHLFILEKLGTIDWANTNISVAVGNYWNTYMTLELQKYNAVNPPMQEADGTYVSFNLI